MSSLSDTVNKVSRVVTPELRAEDERKRDEAEARACQELLSQKKDLEAELARSSKEVEKLSKLAAAAALELEAVNIDGLKADFMAAAAAFQTIESYEFAFAYEPGSSYEFRRFTTQSTEVFQRAAALLRPRNSPRDWRTRNMKDVKNGLEQYADNIAALKSLFASPIDPNSREGKKILFRDVVTGYKTERRMGYPIFFLYETFKVPVTKRVPLTPAERSAVVRAHLDALEVIETKVPGLIAANDSIEAAVAKVLAHNEAKRNVRHTKAALKSIPAGLVEKAERHMAGLKK